MGVGGWHFCLFLFSILQSLFYFFFIYFLYNFFGNNIFLLVYVRENFPKMKSMNVGSYNLCQHQDLKNESSVCLEKGIPVDAILNTILHFPKGLIKEISNFSTTLFALGLEEIKRKIRDASPSIYISSRTPAFTFCWAYFNSSTITKRIMIHLFCSLYCLWQMYCDN